MRNKELIKILKNQTLREGISPSKAWVDNTRAMLIVRANKENELKDLQVRIGRNILFTFFNVKALKRATAALAMVALIFYSFVGVVSASQSLPGDALYGVKIATERARLEFSPKERRALLRTEFAGRRLREIIKLLEKQVTGQDKKVKKAVTIFKEEMKNVTRDVGNLSEGSSANALEMATKIDAKVDEYLTIIKNNETNLSSSVRAEVKKAKQVALQASFKTAEVIVGVSTASAHADSTKTVLKGVANLESQIAGLAPSLRSTSTPLAILEPAKAALADARVKLQANDLKSAVALLTAGSVLVGALEESVQVSVASSDALQLDVKKDILPEANSAPVISTSNTDVIIGKEQGTVKIDLFFDNGF